MDGAQNALPNGQWPRQRRTASNASQTSTLSKPGPSSVKTPHLATHPSAQSVRSNESDTSEILSPIPRRHPLHPSQARPWLDPASSPSSSRAASPASPLLAPLSFRNLARLDASAPLTPTSTNATSARRPDARARHLSFSSLKDGSVGSVRSRRVSRLARVGEAAGSEAGSVRSAHGRERAEDGAARRWVRWMHDRRMRRLVVLGGVGAAVLVKWAVGLGSYSGQGTPPMYGDYEAQRHWMEITFHLPFSQWYTYDLQYWGLDYPPLTAYVSWLCGYIGSWFDPTWFALTTSRGIETPGSKVYMRATVLALDTLIYVPALLWFVRTWHANRSTRTQNAALLSLLFHPALLLVDFGHFQYNGVMLGLALGALSAFARGHDALGAVLFTLALGFKQMALYYAPAVGTYLLAKCLWLGPSRGLKLLIKLALTTTLTLTLLFAPWLPPFAPLSSILDPLTRIFPLARGLFEDKVANFWCASDVVLKWRRRLDAPVLVRVSAGLTALGFVPAVAGLLRAGWVLRRPAAPSEKAAGAEKTDAAEKEKESEEAEGAANPLLPLLPYALLSSAMSFFLFSFQVHEKTILLPLLPLSLLLSGAAPGAGAEAREVWEWGMLGGNVAVFSMWPLLERDGLGVQYIALLLLWNRLMGSTPLPLSRPSTVPQLLSCIVYPSAVIIHLAARVLPPPARYPDLYPVLTVLVCTPVFGAIWAWAVKRGVEVLWGVGGLGGGKTAVAGQKSGAAQKDAGAAQRGVGERRTRPESEHRDRELWVVAQRDEGAGAR